jgi:hypothetical protein
MSEAWTSLRVAERLREAADTLALLPNPHAGRRLTSAWPDIVRSFKELRPFTDPAKPRVTPAAAAIDRMDEVLLDWLPRLPGEEVKLIWGWMAKLPAEATARRFGISRSTLHRRRLAVFHRLAILLNAKK